MPSDIHFGQLVKDQRSALGLTQAELANRVTVRLLPFAGLRRIHYGRPRTLRTAVFLLNPAQKNHTILTSCLC